MKKFKAPVNSPYDYYEIPTKMYTIKDGAVIEADITFENVEIANAWLEQWAEYFHDDSFLKVKEELLNNLKDA